MATNRIDKYHGNVAAWKSLADLQIDYFSQFIKAWIPFNAWFSTTYPNENTDREILSRVKKETNPFRDKIIFYLSKSDSESKDFLNQLGKLHLALENNPIPSIERKISFCNVVIDKNTNPSFDDWVKKERSYSYKAIVTYNHTAQSGKHKINVQVLDMMATVSQGKMNLNQSDWDIVDLKGQPQFKLTNIPKENLRIQIQNAVLNCYNEINPLKPSNLLLPPIRRGNLGKYKPPPNSITVDIEKNLFFINEPDKIVKAIIEILYNLRNVLFHGEINPSPEVQQIYKEAYYILYPLIKVLN